MTTDFEELSSRIITDLHNFDPEFARSFTGLHENYDGVMPDYSRSGIENFIQTFQKDLAELNELAQSTSTYLSEQQNFDIEVLRFKLQSLIFGLVEKRDWEKSPLFYLNALNLVIYSTRDYAPLSERIAAMNRQQEQIPAFLEAARANLKPPFANPVMEFGLMLTEGAVRFRQKDIVELLQNPELSPELREAGLKANRLAQNAIQAWIDWLKGQKDQYNDDFAIGREMYQKLLRYDELVEMPVEEVLAAGERDLEQNFQALHETAKLIDPKASLQEVLEKMQVQHPSSAELIGYTNNRLEKIREYLLEHDLITIADETRPVVAPTPPPMRFGFAMMRTAGPYEKSPESYYYISLPEPDWDAKRQEDWLQLFYYPQLDNISVHEVYPGHFIHMRHVNQAKSEVGKQIMASMAHIEGWAHYTEQMMLEEGFGNGDPELKIAQLLGALWRDCRYVASVKMHTQGMSVEEAMGLFKRYMNMAEGPARAEVLRGVVQPGYFSYTLGKLMLLKLREDLKKRDGAKFDLKAFHDACVGNGAPPVPLLRRKLLGAEDKGSLL